MTAAGALMLAIVAEVSASLALKAVRGTTDVLPALVVVAGYGCALVLLSVSLRTLPVGPVYAAWSGLGIVLTTAGGWWLYREPISPLAFASIALVILGLAGLAFANVEARAP